MDRRKNRHQTSTNIFRLAAWSAVLISLVMTGVMTGCGSGRDAGTGIFGRSGQLADSMEVIVTHADIGGLPLEIEFRRGRAHNHPLMAIWAEDMDGNYLKTLYVALSIAEGVYRHGDASTGRWMPGPVRRPAALPYWGHQRGIQAPDGYFLPTREEPLPDAMTGPTPKTHFLLKSRLPESVPGKFRVLLEINQSWDWNRYWTNDKFPGDLHYMSSSQPAVVYEAVIDTQGERTAFPMKAVGHSHWSGATGELFPDLSTLTTALEIAETVVVRLPSLP